MTIAIASYQEVINWLGNGDPVTRKLLEDILESEEEHVDFLETQFEMIDRMGLQNYIQLQSKPTED